MLRVTGPEHRRSKNAALTYPGPVRIAVLGPLAAHAGAEVAWPQHLANSLTNLDQLPPTGAVLITAPLKIKNGSGSPNSAPPSVKSASGADFHS